MAFTSWRVVASISLMRCASCNRPYVKPPNVAVVLDLYLKREIVKQAPKRVVIGVGELRHLGDQGIPR